jgi:RecA-family ATPase
MPVIANAPRKLRGQSLNDILQQPVPEMKWLIENVIREGGFTYIYGPPGSFKTSFTLFAMLNACAGRNVCGFRVTRPLDILWIDEECGENGIKFLTHIISKGLQMKDNTIAFKGKFHICYRNAIDIILDTASIEEILIKEHYDIVVIDSIAKVFPYDEKDKTNVRKIFSNLSPLMDKYNTGFVLIHHSRKEQQDKKRRSLNEISGSIEFSSQCDDLLYLDLLNTKDITRFSVYAQKTRYHKAFDTINIDVVGDEKTYLQFEYKGLAKDNKKAFENKQLDGAKVALIRYIENNPKECYTTTEFIDALKKHYKSDVVRDALYRDEQLSLKVLKMVFESSKQGTWILQEET